MTSVRTARSVVVTCVSWASPKVSAYGDMHASSASTSPPMGGSRRCRDSAEHGAKELARVREGGGDDRTDDATRHRPPQVAAVQDSCFGQLPHGLEADPGDDDVDGVARERPEYGGDQCLVVLEAAAVKDLESEERRAEGRAEQHGEAGRHPGDGDDP